MGAIKQIRECTGYIDRCGGLRWRLSCKWAIQHCRHQHRPREVYTTDEPPHQCDPCAREQEREDAAPLRQGRLDFKGFGACDACGERISSPADAVICIDRHKALYRANEALSRIGEVVELHSIPPRLPWRVTHLKCTPSGGDKYIIEGEGICTSRGVLVWTLRLMGTRWLVQTEWECLVRRLFKVGSRWE